MKLAVRLAVYAAALLVIVTARLPEPSALSALRTSSPGSALDPVRVVIAAVLALGVVMEFLRRRRVWH